MGEKQLRTVRQVAEELGLAPVTVRTWMAQRRLSYVRLGRAVRIPASEVQRILDSGTVPTLERRR
jgi:excisionase family DNA binding protein